jgi:hypothetical protein
MSKLQSRATTLVVTLARTTVLWERSRRERASWAVPSPDAPSKLREPPSDDVTVPQLAALRMRDDAPPCPFCGAREGCQELLTGVSGEARSEMARGYGDAS